MSSERDIKTSKGIFTHSTYDFIKEVELRPPIWDREHINRRNRLLDWHDVIRACLPCFDELPMDEQDQLTTQFTYIWKCLTNVLMKSIKNTSDPNYRPYRFAHHMEFYLNYRGITLDQVGTPEQFLENDEIASKALENRTKKRLLAASKVKTTKVITTMNSDNNDDNFAVNNNDFDPSIFCQATEQATGNNDFREAELNSIRCEPVTFMTSYDNDAEDPDQDFFDSIQPFLNKLNGKQMLDFKIEFLEILKKYHSQVN